MTEECGNTIGIRYPDAPVDQWETATCIQQHEGSPGAERVIHDSGDGWRWMLLDGFEEQAPLIVPSAELKMLRESLEWVQGAAQNWIWEQHAADPRTDIDSARRHLDRIDQIIAEVERHQPIGSDGKHGDLHTPTCGCEDR